MSSASSGYEQQDSSALVRLPAELINGIASHLPNRDIKSLRSTCTVICARVSLRLDRVFLSANSRNVEVFRAIADHDVFRKRVNEIIWDDAILVDEAVDDNADIYELMDDNEPEGCPGWYARACNKNVDHLRWSKGNSTNRPHLVAQANQIEAQMSLQSCWDYYQQLLRQQNDVLESEAHITALRYGLERFPSLKRITVTPAAHGFLFTPLYQTPMIRGFPYGFNYPIPRGWPTPDMDSEGPYEVSPWSDDEAEKLKWRGFCIVIRELAGRESHEHHVSELVLDVNHLNTGLSCRLFDQRCEEYNSLVGLLRRPGFSRLDLALLADGQEYDGWSSFRSGYLQQALAEAKDLQYLNFRSQIDISQFEEATWPGTSESTEHFTPLSAMFPVHGLRNLRHFGLSNFLVRQDDLVSLLTALSPTLRSIELSFLWFLGDGGNYRDLLTELRDTLGWRERTTHERPRVRIHVATEKYTPFRYVCVDKEVSHFLYGDGQNPFGHIEDEPNRITAGTGVERDPFEPDHDRPNADFMTLVRLGYIEYNAEAVEKFEQKLTGQRL